MCQRASFAEDDRRTMRARGFDEAETGADVLLTRWTSPLLVAPAAIAIAFAIAGCTHRKSTENRGLTSCAEQYDDEERLRAMVTVQTLVQEWDSDASEHETVSPLDVASSTSLLRCDKGSRADSRRMRAIAVALGHDWQGSRSTQVLLDLGFADPAAIGAFKTRVLADFPAAAFDLDGHSSDWLEYAVLRHLTTAGDLPPAGSGRASAPLFNAATAYAQTQPACWRPEAPSTSQFINPYFELTAHVSVSNGVSDTIPNVDAEQWNTCGKFWSPPDPQNPPQPLDGAVFVAKNWSICVVPSPPFTAAPSSDLNYPERFLWERFYVPLSKGTTHFENILGVWAFQNTRIAADGSVVDAHRLSFHLTNCGNDQVEGAMGGAIGSRTMKVLLDSGFIEVWAEGGRTHVASLKDAQLSDEAANWLPQLSPALKELNDQLGELACCLPH
jgi:hypothetical protein